MATKWSTQLVLIYYCSYDQWIIELQTRNWVTVVSQHNKGIVCH